MCKTNVEEWCEGRPAAMAEVAAFLVGVIPEMIAVYEMHRDGWPEEMRKVFTPKQWLKLYSSHRHLQRFMLENVPFGEMPGIESPLENEPVPMSELPEETADMLRDLPQMEDVDDPEELHAFASENQEFMQQAASFTTSDAFTSPIRIIEQISDISEEDFQRILQRPETIFFLTVWMPCIWEHGQYPAQLMYQARHGDYDAIEKLLRLDKMAVHEPLVVECFHHAQLNKPLLYKKLVKAMATPLRQSRIEYSAKMTIAGFISSCSLLISKMMHALEATLLSRGEEVPTDILQLQKRLEAPDISDLLDAAARDRGESNPYDTDIPDKLPSFKIALQRARKEWDFMFNRLHGLLDRPM